ncbi:MAG: hypothetical protein ACRDOK_21690 [Streptosporangiaceae bacterium]
MVVIWIIVAVVIVGIVIALFGWDRYRGTRKSTGAASAAQPTDEVFNDPESGKRTRVWYNNATGQREYRAE